MLIHQPQLPNMQLFIIGTSLFLERVSPLHLHLLTVLVFCVFFGCLLSLLGGIYSTTSSCSVKFSMLQAMFRGLSTFPLAPSHHMDWLSFVKCFIDVAVYHAPSFSLAFIWFSVAQPRVWGKDCVCASTLHESGENS